MAWSHRKAVLAGSGRRGKVDAPSTCAAHPRALAPYVRDSTRIRRRDVCPAHCPSQAPLGLLTAPERALQKALLSVFEREMSGPEFCRMDVSLLLAIAQSQGVTASRVAILLSAITNCDWPNPYSISLLTFAWSCVCGRCLEALLNTGMCVHFGWASYKGPTIWTMLDYVQVDFAEPQKIQMLLLDAGAVPTVMTLQGPAAAYAMGWQRWRRRPARTLYTRFLHAIYEHETFHEQ